MTEPNTQPPEVKDPEPLRYDPIPIEDVYQWRDATQTMIDAIHKLQFDPNKASMLKYFEGHLLSINDSIDTAHGFNDPQPEEPINEDKMKARQHG